MLSRKYFPWQTPMARQLSKPSTAKCDCDLYTLFLMAEPRYVSCTRLEEVMKDRSHDSINRFLLREEYNPKDLFDENKDKLVLQGGSLSVDDSVIDKPYRDPNKTELVGYFWSGKHKKPVKGINLISLYYTDILDNSYPVNYRIYDKKEGKTKNDYFLEMLEEVESWGLKPAWITGDSWYSSNNNLKYLKNKGLSFLFGVATNRLVSLEKGKEVQVQTLAMTEEGLVVYLKEFGWVKVFCQNFNNEARYYICYQPDLEALKKLSRSEFKQIHDQHWQIETFHRVIKQVCNIERFYVRDKQAIQNHVFCALRAFCKLQTLRIHDLIDNLYQISRELFIPVIRQFILDHHTQTPPYFCD
jgi:hypothetical protein